MVLAGLGLNPAGVSLFRMRATEHLTRNWRGIGFRLRLEASRSSDLDLGGCIIFCLWLHCINEFSFCFFRPAERNVTQFYGGWFWQVWAWSLLGFPCFGCVPHRTIWGGIGFRLGLKSCQGLPWFWFAFNGFPDAVSAARLEKLPLGLESFWGFFVSLVVAMLGFLCLWLHCWGFLCFWLHHLSVSLGRQNATLESFTGDGFGRFGLESCWGFPVSHACPTKPFDFRLRLESCQGLPWFCFAFNGFPDAVSAARLETLPLGLESCWGFHVSHACPTEPFQDELASA